VAPRSARHPPAGARVGCSVQVWNSAGFWAIVKHSHGARNTTHQCGTLVFGHDPRASVLDPYCRTHDVHNLFVVDASFFPSSAAVNPALTIAAQALRVADHIAERDLRVSVADQVEAVNR